MIAPFRAISPPGQLGLGLATSDRQPEIKNNKKNKKE